MPLLNHARYDAQNRMTASVQPGMGAISYVYDGQGRRVQKSVATQSGTTTVTTFIYDGTGALAAEYGAPTTTGTEYLLADALGSTRLVLGSGGNVTERLDYLPFGEELPVGVGGRTAPYSGGVYPSGPDIENQKFTGKERDAETGLDYFGARYYGGALGRFASADLMLVMGQKMTDPQQWNMYSYGRNNPLRMVDTNGMWPTDIHNAIINGAFGGLSSSQRGTLQAASKSVDGYVNGGQTAALAYQHGMRAPGQSKEEARRLGDTFIAAHESNASGIAKANGGVNDAALSELGTALHTVSDRTSPAHMGEQVWTGGGEPGITSIGGPAGFIVGAGIDGVRAEIHIREEATITLDEYHGAIDAERTEYLKTFGQDAFTEATGCKQVSGCAYNDSALPANLRKGK